mgnify:CR=1 FL=1
MTRARRQQRLREQVALDRGIRQQQWPDNRDQGDPDNAKFCGAGALSMDDRENCAVLMRVAMLSSLEAANTTSNLGFRCAKDVP